MFDKSADEFPVKRGQIFLSHCSVSPLYSGAFERIREICEEQQNRGLLVFEESYVEILERLRAEAERLMAEPEWRRGKQVIDPELKKKLEALGYVTQ